MQRHVPSSRGHHAFVRTDLDRIGARFGLSASTTLELKAIAAVLPFRTNAYVLEDLIRWHEVPEDPVYRSTFPQPGMLRPADLERMIRLVGSGAPQLQVRAAAREIRSRLGSHAARRLGAAWSAEGASVPGIQHRYRDTVLFLPNQAQACRAYCTYCFCWPPVTGIRGRRTAQEDVASLCNYVSAHREVSGVRLTGGEPLAMETAVLRRYVEPLLGPEREHVIRIDIESKAPAYWPQRFLGDPDADALLRFFEDVQSAGKQLALRVQYTHPRELETKAAQDALRRITSTGVTVRCLAPVLRGVNDEAATWAELWRNQVRLGAIADSMLVGCDAGPGDYFEVSLARASQIHREAHARVCGLVGTAGGPSMSAAPGDIRVIGETRIHGERLFVLEFVQARDARWVGRPFFARWDVKASWLDQLRPAFGENSFFYEEALRRMQGSQG